MWLSFDLAFVFFSFSFPSSLSMLKFICSRQFQCVCFFPLSYARIYSPAPSHFYAFVSSTKRIHILDIQVRRIIIKFLLSSLYDAACLASFSRKKKASLTGGAGFYHHLEDSSLRQWCWRNNYDFQSKALWSGLSCCKSKSDENEGASWWREEELWDCQSLLCFFLVCAVSSCEPTKPPSSNKCVNERQLFRVFVPFHGASVKRLLGMAFVSLEISMSILY